MPFQIEALPYAPFADYFSRESPLPANARFVVADRKPGYPCRVSLEDAKPGERILLINHEHLPGSSPFAARHAIYVRENARQAMPAPGALPPCLHGRIFSVRAYDQTQTLVAAALTHERSLDHVLREQLTDAAIAEAHIHNAAPGCYAARAIRAT